MYYQAMTALAAILLASAASAGGLQRPVDAPVYVAPPAPAPLPQPQSPDWTGVYMGYSAGGVVGETSDDPQLSGEGPAIGFHVGVDRDFGDYVLGASVEHTSTDVNLDDVAKLSSLSMLKVRGGLDLGGAMTYVTTGIGRAALDNGNTSGGGFYGGGVEAFVTEGLTIGLEVSRHDYRTFGDEDTIKLGATSTQLKASFRF